MERKSDGLSDFGSKLVLQARAVSYFGARPKMKVLMVTPFYYPTAVGGTESFIDMISNKLNEFGIPTEVMTFNVGLGWNLSRRNINGVDVTEVPSFYCNSKLSSGVFQANFIPLGRFVKLYDKYDIIHFHNDVDLTFPIFSYFVRKPKILHCHCLAISTYKFYKRSFVSRNILKNVANMYIAPSMYIFKLLLDLGVPEKRIRMVPVGVNVDEFRPQGNDKDENLLLFVGRLEPVKGLHVLLRSLECLETPVRLVIVGPGSWNRDYSNSMLRLVEEMKKKSIHNITYLGVIEKEKLIDLYQEASVLVRPDTDGVSGGISSMEALACGTPVIGTGNEVIVDGVNGIIVPPNDAVRLAYGIRYLLNDRKTRQQLGKEARRLMVERFSSDAIAKKLIQIYDEIL